MWVTEFFKISGGVITILNFVIMVVVAVGGWIAFRQITMNDLKNFGTKFDELTKALCETNKNVLALTSNVSYIRGRCDSADCLSVRPTRKYKAKKVKK